MIYACSNEFRRNLIKGVPTVNGIDFLEVVDNPGDPVEVRQTVLNVHLINDFDITELASVMAVIEGGERIRNIQVVGITVDTLGTPPPTVVRVLTVKVSEAGDFSTYTLRLVSDLQTKLPPPGFDIILSAIKFSFRVSCLSDFDCQPVAAPDKIPLTTPQINYLAKDYATFRQLMLDRMAFLVPDWQERNPADLGITLIELLAYVGDYLSYQQDAIATEAYLHTARKRTSVRRHARLVDYFMHDGCNARTWVQVLVNPTIPSVFLEKVVSGIPTRFITKVPQLNHLKTFKAGDPAFNTAIEAKSIVFELMRDETLFSAHNEMAFYTWGNANCFLPEGTTSATLAGNFTDLHAGMVLILAEVRGRETGLPEDADPTHRHAVRLTEVTFQDDLLGMLNLPDPDFEDLLPRVTNIKWHSADALPFALCISTTRENQVFDNVSKALGNIVPADHGLTVIEKTSTSLIPDKVSEQTRFRPMLNQPGLTHAASHSDTIDTPASAFFQWKEKDALPVIFLREMGQNGQIDETDIWKPRRDLLSTISTEQVFVVETEDDGTSFIRFGNGQSGAKPSVGASFRAKYRIGNGPAGNIGAGTIAHLVTEETAITLNPDMIIGITNPLPASGGKAAESMEEVRQKAPFAFRWQERAVTPADYEEIAKRTDDTIQRAACSFRWTGSWRTAFLSVDRKSGAGIDSPFRQQTRDKMERYRMAGYDLEIDEPQYVPLEMTMEVCVEKSYLASSVKEALLRVFSRHFQPGGQLGLFHPDQFTFGQTVYLSPFYAAAQAVAGVLSVQVTTFQRQGDNDSTALAAGKMTMNRLEVARLDNDPNFPDRGIFNLIMKGGR